LKLAEQGKDTFFISLGATDYLGRPKNHSTFFDWFTKIEFRGTDVSAVSAQDLVTFNDQQIPAKRSKLTKITDDVEFPHIYDLLQVFINEHPGCNFIVDEFPISQCLGV